MQSIRTFDKFLRSKNWDSFEISMDLRSLDQISV